MLDFLVGEETSGFSRSHTGVWHGLSRYSNPDFGREEEIMEAHSMVLLYQCDIAGTSKV
jgi:hypothetical protein